MYYGTLEALVESLVESKTSGNLALRLDVLAHPEVPVADEDRVWEDTALAMHPFTRSARSRVNGPPNTTRNALMTAWDKYPRPCSDDKSKTARNTNLELSH